MQDAIYATDERCAKARRKADLVEAQAAYDAARWLYLLWRGTGLQLPQAQRVFDAADKCRKLRREVR